MRFITRCSKLFGKIFWSPVNIVVTPVPVKTPVQNIRPGTAMQKPTYRNLGTWIPIYIVCLLRRLESFSRILNSFWKGLAYTFYSTGNLHLAAKNKKIRVITAV